MGFDQHLTSMIKALIFDFDGLILDTETAGYQTWQEIYREHGCELPLATWAVCIGTTSSGFDPCDNLEVQLGRSIDRAGILGQYRDRNNQLIEQQRVLPGVEAHLKGARRLNLKIGLASSSPRSWVVPHLSRLALLTYFDLIRTADDVAKTKPDPALYRRALRDLGVASNEAIAIEDSPNGALAAKRAGIFCVAVPNEITSQLAIDAADLEISSLNERSLEELIAQVGKSARLPD